MIARLPPKTAHLANVGAVPRRVNNSKRNSGPLPRGFPADAVSEPILASLSD
jgi:hypothetical protein